jgi:hypothetical protein
MHIRGFDALLCSNHQQRRKTLQTKTRRTQMNTFKKSIIAIATVSALAVAATAPAHAGSKWKKGLGAGIGLGIGLGVAGAILNSGRPQTVVVHQPRCWTQQQAVYNQYGQFAGYQNVRVCN